MTKTTLLIRRLPALWARFAVFLSFVAVFSALLAPASMLAEEVRTGKLGGVCNVSTVAASGDDANAAGDSGSARTGSHCELCGSPGLAVLSLQNISLPSAPGHRLLVPQALAQASAAIGGLPFSRGPPHFLT